MIRKVVYNNKIIEYDLQRKKVKNINLRINHDLSIYVSASKRVSVDYIDNFVISKGDFILSALAKISARNKAELIPLYCQEEFPEYIKECFNYVEKLFYDRINIHPTLKMRKMTSCWGTCNYAKNIVTLNKNLIYCTKEQIYYVIVHEFAHFIEHNHSKVFYNIVEQYCKNYKELRKEMKNINIRRG